MDSTGATVRTPRRRLSRSQLQAHGGGSPTHTPQQPITSRSFDGQQYGSILPTFRVVDHAAPTSSSASSANATKGPPHPSQSTVLPPSSSVASILKTPRHSYHHRRSSLLNSVLARTTAAQQHLLAPDDVDINVHLPLVDHTTQQPKQQPQHGHNVKIVLYGLLNTVILIPIMISFAQIIFRDPVFAPFMTELIKLVLMSAAIHQLCFTLASSLSFAIGQVQDAGLIFLSAMATSTVQSLRTASSTTNTPLDMETVLSTVLCTLAGSTALLGIALLITGKLKIASFVQYLPMPVVGGYLAYIGFYCLEAGLSMMASVTIKDPRDWLLLAHSDALLLITPGLVAGIAIFYLLSRCDHVAVLPACMFAIIAVFYTVLLLTNTSLEAASAAGWVSPSPQAPSSILDSYRLFDPHKATFEFVSTLAPAWIAMYFVVAFSSSLDVAAIEMALGTSLDHNHELQTVGIANFVSGLTGGFTGSYIFSQTIFTLRGNLDSRLNGLLVVVFEVLVVLSPFSVLAYVPKVFFGALQTLIAADLMVEWLYYARLKLLKREFAIVWVTFVAMNVVGLDVGILVGVVVAAFNFIASYIRATRVRRVVKRSRVERDRRERALLQSLRMAIVTLELDGFLFFGSSVQMMDEVRKHVLVSVSEAAAAHAAAHASPLTTFRHARPSSSVRLDDDDDDDEEDENATRRETTQLVEANEDSDEALATLDEHTGFTVAARRTTHPSGDPSDSNSDSPHLRDRNRNRNNMSAAVRTRFFILDFANVRGVDATAVRSCFLATKQLLATHGIALVFSSVPPSVERLLRAQNVIEPDDKGDESRSATTTATTGTLVFESVDKALEWCEDELLVDAGVIPLSETVARDDDGSCRMQLLHELLPAAAAAAAAVTTTTDTTDNLLHKTNDATNESNATVLTKAIGDLYIETFTKSTGESVYCAGDRVAGVYFIGCGKVDVFLPTQLHERMGFGFYGRKRIMRVCQGGIIGAAEFLLNKRHQFSADVKRDKTFLFFLSSTKFAAMQQRHPRIAARFQLAMLQSMARSVMESNISDD